MTGGRKLSAQSLGSSTVAKPGYDRASVTPGIVHLGTGAFHRAHQAVYIDDLLANEPGWGIIGASLRSAATAKALNAQNGLYTLCENGPDGSRNRIIGSVLQVVATRNDPEPLLQQMADPAVRIVSLTVTEKGYCHDPTTGELIQSHPDIVADLAKPENPCSAPGIIVEALRRRREAGAGPFTVLSCDNLSGNGKTTACVVLALAALRDPELASWIDGHVTFPCTMVDRIAPATTPDDVNRISGDIGMLDACPVVTEPFCQWVIEDNFCAGRPAFEQAGAQLVSNAQPYEEMKLRMLNGSHSALAYLGYLAGFETIAEATAIPALTKFIRDMMSDEIIPTLKVSNDTDLPSYREALISRFQNKGLQHRTWQIAMDGSQKLPQRFLNTISDLLAQNASFKQSAMGVAAWMVYVSAIDEEGKRIDVRDPLSSQLRVIGEKHRGDAESLVSAFLNMTSIFSEALSENPCFKNEVIGALNELQQHGAYESVLRLNG